MALSDALATMSARAKQAEDSFHAAQTSQRANLEEEIAHARSSAEANRDALRDHADVAKSDVSSWWRELQHQWDRQVQEVRVNVAQKREEHDAKRAAHRADVAEADAEFAAAIAKAAIDEAEYAAMEAVLARAKADELAVVA